MSPSADDFSEEFTGCTISSLIDFFSGYDQVELAEECQDLTAFIISFDLMRITTLAQDATNLVAQFVRIVLKILALHLQD